MAYHVTEEPFLYSVTGGDSDTDTYIIKANESNTYFSRDGELQTEVTSFWAASASIAVNSFSQNCLVIRSTAPAPWNNPEDVVTVQMQILINNIKAMIATPVLFLFSTPTNLLSMVVFAKHGLSNRTNVCLFSLALVNWLYGIFCFCIYGEQMWSNALSDYPSIGRGAQFIINNHWLGMYGLYWSSMFISAITAVERCACVVFPLGVHTLLKTRTLWVIISLGVVLITGARFAVSKKYTVTCVYDEGTNTTRLIFFVSEYYLRHREMVDTLDVVVFGLFLPIATFAVVAIATTATAICLRKALMWRRYTAMSRLCSSISAKEIALTKMLIILSVYFIVCNFSNVVFRVICVAIPGLSHYGRYYNLYFSLLGIVEMAGIANTSLNFLVYFSTGTKYRQTILGFFKNRRIRTQEVPRKK